VLGVGGLIFFDKNKKRGLDKIGGAVILGGSGGMMLLGE